MKKLVTTLCLAIIFLSANAHAYREGENLLNLGIGIGSPYFKAGYQSTVPVNPTLVYEKA